MSDNTLIKKFVKSLSDTELDTLRQVAQYEYTVRHMTGPAGPVGPPGPSYQDLVDRYGSDGHKLIQEATTGHAESLVITKNEVSEDRLLLDDLPFDVTYDDATKVMVYTVGREDLKKLVDPKSGFVKNPIIGQLISECVDVEILIDPMLHSDSPLCISARNGGEKFRWHIPSTLVKLVEWYNLIRVDEELYKYQPVIKANEAEALNLLSYNGQSLVREVVWMGRTYKTAPFRTDVKINTTSCSIIPELVEAGRIHPATHLDKSPVVTSMYVQVGKHLFRVMTNTLPQARFVETPYFDGNEILQFEVGTNLSEDGTDCFGNDVPWLDVDSLGGSMSLIIEVSGTFRPETGAMALTGRGRLVGRGPAGPIVAELLGDSIEVVGFTIDGQVKYF